MGSAQLHGVGRALRFLLRQGCACALTCAFATAQGEPRPFDVSAAIARIKELATPSRSADVAVRNAALDELASIEAELDRSLEGRDARLDKQAVQAMYRVTAARAERDVRAGFDARIALCEKSRAFAQLAASPEAEAKARLVAGNLCIREGRLGDALNRLTAALDDVPGAVKTRPFVLGSLAEAERQLELWTDALDHLDLAQETLGPGAEYDALRRELPGTRASIFLDLGLADLAAPNIDAEAAELARLENPADQDRIAVLIHCALRALVDDDHQGALAYIDEAFADSALFARNPGWHATLLLLAARAHSNLERVDPRRERRAEALLRGALQVPELVPRDRLGARLRLAELRLRERDVTEASALLDQCTHELSSPDGPESVSDRVELATLRARLALERGDAVGELSARRTELDLELRSWMDKWALIPPRLEGLGLLHHGPRRAPFSELTRLDLAIDGAERGAELALERWMRVQALGSIVREAGGGAGTIEDVRRELLSEDRGALVYQSGPDRCHVFALDRNRILCRELANADSLEDLRSACVATRASAGVDAKAREERERALAAALAPPEIEAVLSHWKGATLVGLDLFGDVPFETLPLCGSRRIGAEIALDALPSLPLGLLLARRPSAQEAALDLALVCAPEPSAATRERWPELTPLSFTNEDRAALTHAYDADRVLVLSGAQATRDAVLTQAMGRARVVQFLAHSVQDFDRERPAVLVLTPGDGDDGSLASSDVAEAGATRLVILTSCRSGLGPARRGDDALAHLGGAWLAAGAGCVITAPANLSYGAALRLSARMQEHLRGAGESPAEALRAARRELAADPSGAADAPLRVLGLGHVALFPARAQRAATDSKTPDAASAGTSALEKNESTPSKPADAPSSRTLQRTNFAVVISLLAVWLALRRRRLRQRRGA